VSKLSEPLTPNLDEAPRDTDPRASGLSLGISRGTDGSTDVRTDVRGVPALVAHTQVWTIAIVVAGFVLIMAIFGWVLRAQLPPPPRDPARDVGGMSHKGTALQPVGMAPTQ
jgi:hypothetical protein